MVKLVICDIDGILTDGKKTYDSSGKVISKTFCDKDFTVIKKFKSIGIPVIWLSGDIFNGNIAYNRNIPFYSTRNYEGKLVDKASFIPKIEEQMSINRQDICFIGDDIFDISIAKLVGYPFCPLDATEELKEYCTVINRKGGENCIDALYDILYHQGHLGSVYDIQKVIELDADEK